jgi:hypothetical protein
MPGGRLYGGEMARPARPRAQCSFVDEDGVRCEREHLAKGYCRPHYLQLRRGEKLRPVGTREWNKGRLARRSYALKNFLN